MLEVSGSLSCMIDIVPANEELIQTLVNSPITSGDRVIGVVTGVNMEQDLWYGRIWDEETFNAYNPGMLRDVYDSE